MKTAMKKSLEKPSPSKPGKAKLGKAAKAKAKAKLTKNSLEKLGTLPLKDKVQAASDGAEDLLTSSEVEKPWIVEKNSSWLTNGCMPGPWKIVSKFHTFIHMWMGCKFMNPRKQWCFKGEDYVGHISKMAHSISFGVSSTRISNKLCPKYRVLQHFLICRDMEQLSWKDEAGD